MSPRLFDELDAAPDNKGRWFHPGATVVEAVVCANCWQQVPKAGEHLDPDTGDWLCFDYRPEYAAH